MRSELSEKVWARKRSLEVTGMQTVLKAESRWSHLRGGQTEKTSGSSGILTFRVQDGMEKLAKRATEEENQKSRTPGGKYGKCFKQKGAIIYVNGH